MVVIKPACGCPIVADLPPRGRAGGQINILTYTVPVGDTLPFSEVKAHLSELADRVERQHDRILVTRNGRPSFVILSPDDLESLEETIDILSDDELMDSLRKSLLEAAEGQLLPLDDLL